MHPVTYKRRRNIWSRGEREWRVEEDALVAVGGSGRATQLAWKEIVSVRLCHEPMRGRPWRYVFELQPKSGARVRIDNAHRCAEGVYEDQSASFTPFVRAALGRIAVASPKARALIGETGRRYFFLLLAALVGFGALAVALTLVRSPLDDLPYATLIKLGIILLMLPIFWRWVVGAMPRGVALDNIPDRALPPAPASAIGVAEVSRS